MTANGVLETVAAAGAPTLADKLEFAILSVLIHYNGSYEETLPDWYAALRLGLPELRNSGQVRDVFQRLSAGRIVNLEKSEPESPIDLDAADNRFFASGTFNTVLTSHGLVYWNTIRIQPGLPSAR